MTIIENQPAQSFPIHKHIDAAAKSLSVSDRKTISKIRVEIDSLNAISTKFQSPRMGQSHSLDESIHLASLKLTDEPSEANALILHELVYRKETLAISSPVVSASIQTAVNKKIAELEPIALKLIDAAEVDFLAEVKKHEGIEFSSFTPEIVDFSSRVEASKQAFNKKREWIKNENASAHFLILELGLFE